MLNYGELVAIVGRKERVYVRKLVAGARFHLYEGTIACDDLVGRPPGCEVLTSKGEKVLVFRPTLADFVLKMPRQSNIVYPKDLAMILLWADIFPGCRVLTAGAGSGALLLALARAVGESGEVFCYDYREDMLALSRRNLEDYLGPRANVHLALGDVYRAIAERELDRVLLDVPEPWQALDCAAAALKPGGILLAYVPTVGQAERFARAVDAHPAYVLPEIMEVLFRTWYVGEKSVRPNFRMVGHTGFLCRALRITPLAEVEPEGADRNSPSEEPLP